jgi:hypothetical protein
MSSLRNHCPKSRTLVLRAYWELSDNRFSEGSRLLCRKTAKSLGLDFRCWHQPDIPGRPDDVRCLGKNGRGRPTVIVTRLTHGSHGGPNPRSRAASRRRPISARNLEQGWWRPEKVQRTTVDLVLYNGLRRGSCRAEEDHREDGGTRARTQFTSRPSVISHAGPPALHRPFRFEKFACQCTT